MAACLLAIFSTNVFASDTVGFSGSGEFGLSNSSGNTENTSVYGSIKLDYNQTHYVVKSAIEAKYKSENGTQTEERYIVDMQLNRFYSEDKSYYSFTGLRLEKNRFEDIELDSTLSLGLGKMLYKTEASNLTGELGAGYQNIDYITSGIDSEGQAVAVAKLDFTHQINDQVNFMQDLKYTTGSTQAKLESNTAFAIKVSNKMNLKASYKYRHNSDPAAGAKKTDTQTMLTLVYDF